MFADQDCLTHAVLADRLDGVAPGVLGGHIFFGKGDTYGQGWNLLARHLTMRTRFARSLWSPRIRRQRSSGRRWLPGCGLSAAGWLGRYGLRQVHAADGDRFFPICAGFSWGMSSARKLRLAACCAPSGDAAVAQARRHGPGSRNGCCGGQRV